MWNWWFDLLPTRDMRRADGRHERLFIAQARNVIRLGRDVFVFYHQGCHAPTRCVQWQLQSEADRDKSLINTFSWWQDCGALPSHDSALTRKRQTETHHNSSAGERSRRQRMLYWWLNARKLHIWTDLLFTRCSSIPTKQTENSTGRVIA